MRPVDRNGLTSIARWTGCPHLRDLLREQIVAATARVFG
jgi:hypothetical protein